jgi:hypothetical protein
MNLSFLAPLFLVTALLGQPSLVNAQVATEPVTKDSSFLGSFPQLKDYVYQEPSSGFYLGFGASPIGLLKDRFMISANVFELHWIRDRWDIDILKFSFGFTRAQSSSVQSTQFTFRAAPKYRLFGNVSIGPLIGYELVSFPNITSKLQKDVNFTPFSEPFSSRGFVYGGEVSQTWKIGQSYLLQVSEVVYKQTYSTKQTAEGWNHIYDDAALRKDTNQIDANFVMMVEASFLY